MFHISSANARQCFERATLARYRADRAGAERSRDDWLKLERGWLALGQSHKFADRLQVALVINGLALGAAVGVTKMVAG